MGLFIGLTKNRTERLTITAKDADGVAVTFDSGDVFNLAIGRAGSTPLLHLRSDSSPNANGSTVSAANPSTVVVSEGDLESIYPGIYDCSVWIVDASDSSRRKHAEKGVVHVKEAFD
jgi:hypothetical protein